MACYLGYGIFGPHKLIEKCTNRNLNFESRIMAILTCVTRTTKESLNMMGSDDLRR
jgi:hypothetical protein